MLEIYDLPSNESDSLCGQCAPMLMSLDLRHADQPNQFQ